MMFDKLIVCYFESKTCKTMDITKHGSIGPNCPGISGTVTDFIGPFRIPDSFIIVPEVEERRAIKPLVAQRLALLGVYGGITFSRVS